MKKFIIPALIISATSPGLYGLVNLGEGQIDLNLRVSAIYDTEIQSRDLGEEDFVLSIRPSLRYSRNSRNFDFAAEVGIDSRTYLDNGEYDNTDIFFDLNISPSLQMQTSRFIISGDIILNSETRSEESVGQIITTRNYGASAQLIYDPNRHYTITGNTGYEIRDPDDPRYNKVETFDASGTISVPMNEDILLDGRIGFEDTSSDGVTSDSQTYTYSVGMSGDLLPKVSGDFSAGMQDRKFDSGFDDTNPYFSASLSWAADDLSTVALAASQSLGTTIDDRSSETSSIRLTAKRNLSRDLSASAYIGYEKEDYSSLIESQARDDKSTLFGASLTYKLVRWGSIGLDLQYRDQSSSIAEFDYDRIQTGIVFNGKW